MHWLACCLHALPVCLAGRLAGWLAGWVHKLAGWPLTATVLAPTAGDQLESAGTAVAPYGP